MCGIAGIVSFRRINASTALRSWISDAELSSAMERMVQQLRHRGPDGSGVEWVAPIHDDGASAAGAEARVLLGNTRLAILDLSTAGRQPMIDPSTGNWVVYNGE